MACETLARPTVPERYQTDPTFRAAVDRLAETLPPPREVLRECCSRCGHHWTRDVAQGPADNCPACGVERD